MRINLLKIVFLALVIVVSGCAKKDEDKKASATSKTLSAYGGKWRYVHDGSEFHISNKNIDRIYILNHEKQEIPEEFSGSTSYALFPSDENLLVQKRKNNTALYLVRDGIKDTVVQGQISNPQASSINIPLAFTSSRSSSLGDLNTVLKNIKTDDIISIKADINGKISSNNIPTGNYEVTIGNDNNGFKDTLEVNGTDTDFGILNIADEQSLNFKTTATISSRIFKNKTTTNTEYSIVSNELHYNYYRGQYIFPLGDYQLTNNDEFDPIWVTITTKNISNKIAEGAQLKIHCKDSSEWIIDCGSLKEKNLVFTPGNINPDKEFNYSFWLQVRPFNSERKDIIIPISVVTVDGIQYDDKVVLHAYKKPRTVKVSMAKSNNGYLFLPGRNSIKLTHSSAYINLPFINNNTFPLLFSNNSNSNQGNYNIINGATPNPKSKQELGLSQEGWNNNYEPENNSENTAPIIKHGEVIGAYLHTGDLDFYKIVTKDEITISPLDDKAQSVLEDKPVAAKLSVKFKASIVDNSQTAPLVWQQVRGPKVDFSTSTNGDSVNLITPAFSQKETLTFKVSFTDAESGNVVFDYLSVTVNPITDVTILTAEDGEQNTIINTSPSNLILNYSNLKDANNTFTINQSLTLNTLTIGEGVTLIIEEGSTLTINNHLFAAGSTIEVKGTLDLKPLAAPSIPTSSTVVLDGTLDVTDDLSVRGTLTHSPGLESGLALAIPGKLIITKEGRIDASAKGLKADDYKCSYYADNKEIIYYRCTGYSTYMGGTHATKGTDRYNNEASTAPTYGDAISPIFLGGSGKETAGGGLINISANNIENNGAILADGQSGSSNGGAGGSILIQLQGNITGNGLIRTKGGSATSNFYSTKGGLGRIAIKGYKEITLSLENINDYGSLWLQPHGAAGGDIYFPVSTTWNVHSDTNVESIIVGEGEVVDIIVSEGVNFTNPDVSKRSDVTLTKLPLPTAE